MRNAERRALGVRRLSDSAFRIPHSAAPGCSPVAATALVLGIGLQQCSTIGGFLTGRKNTTTVTHELVVERVRNVAKLVSAEATVRDVLIYRNTWYGSTKQSLVVVTARLLADQPRGGHRRADRREGAPHRDRAAPCILLATDIVDVNTYDEQRGLWNPFKAEDRDRIFQLARQQPRVQRSRCG